MEKAAIKLKKEIMRRVYFAYSLRVITMPAVTHGAVFVVSLFLMTYFVSFADVFKNIMHVEVASVIPYIFASLLNTEIWTLVLMGVAIFSLLSLRIKVNFPNLVKV